MAEKHVKYEDTTVEHQGVFVAKEVVATMKDWAKSKGYFFYEKKHIETIKDSEKFIELNVLAIRPLTDYATSTFEITIKFDNLKNIVVTVDKKKKKVQEGKVSIQFRGILQTDYANRWDQKPLFWFIRIIFEKYIYSPYISEFEKQMNADGQSLKNEIKSFLNLADYQFNK